MISRHESVSGDNKGDTRVVMVIVVVVLQMI